MTLPQFESKLKAIDPRFRLKRAGWGVMGLYHERTFICRVSDRDILPWDVVRQEEATMAEEVTELNPLGSYKWNRLLHRGRWQIADILFDRGLITHSDKSKLH